MKHIRKNHPRIRAVHAVHQNLDPAKRRIGWQVWVQGNHRTLVPREVVRTMRKDGKTPLAKPVREMQQVIEIQNRVGGLFVKRRSTLRKLGVRRVT